MSHIAGGSTTQHSYASGRFGTPNTTPEFDVLAEQEALTQSRTSTLSRTAGGPGTDERGGARGAIRGAVEGKVQPEPPYEGPLLEGMYAPGEGIFEGVYRDGTPITQDPNAIPMDSKDRERWLAQFPDGSPAQSIAQYHMDFQTGTGQFEGMTYNVQTGEYEDLSAAGGSGDTGFPGPTQGSSGGDSDVDLGQDMQDLFQTLRDDADSREKTNDVRYAALEKSLTDMAAENSRTMSMMMALMNPRREEDESRGSFTYNALGGR